MVGIFVLDNAGALIYNHSKGGDRMSLGSRINEIRKQKNLSIDELCERSGVPKGTLSKITAGITTKPTLDTVRAIANALECRLDDLDDNQKKKDTLTASEFEHIKKYRALDEHGKEIVDTNLDIEHKRCMAVEAEKKRKAEEAAKRKAAQAEADVEVAEEIEPKVKMRDKIVFLNPAAAGSPLFAESDYEYMPFPEDQIPYNADYGIRISGHSMEPDIPDRSIVWVHKTENVESGEVGIFTVDGDAVCKRFYEDAPGVIRLESDNPKYDPVKLHEFSDVRPKGIVVGVVPPSED